MPSILGALTPLEGVRFLFTHSWNGFKVLGAVFLAVTGGEALYADMGHFGRKPIQHGWYFIVLPSLVLQYFGQGALLLSDPGAVENPFFHLVPTFALLPLVGLATIATVIASQAMLTGAFSLSHQAVQMGLLPPLVAVHTSPKERHQIYLPAVNWFLFIGTVCLVGVFQSSSRLAAAYGIAVTGTMVITTLLTFVVARRLWKWSRPLALAVTAFFLVPDLTFLAANSLKIAHGGWLPLLLGGVVFFVMTTWRHGRAIVHDRKATHSLSLERFLKESSFDVRARVPGVAIFLTEHPDLAPPALMRNVHHNHVLHEKVILLKVHTSEVPFVAAEEQITTEKLEGGFFRMKVDYGFMESINIPEALERSSLLKADEAKTYFFSSDNLVATDLPGMAIWREKLFIFLARNTRRASWLLGVPSEQVIQFGERVDL
jgi:KUP system potassium uptake protein